jgi:cyclophilin family peptidyl-prolyl cis-trans isomerase
VSHQPVASDPVANTASPRTRRSREAERQQAQQEAREQALLRAQRKRRMIGVGVVVVVVLATIGGIFAATREKSTTTKTASPSTTASSSPSSTIATNPNPPVKLPTVAPGESIDGPTPCPAADGSSPRVTQFAEAPPMCLDYEKNDYSAVIRTSKGDIELFLLPDASPQTVNNFATLARYHYYDGLPITRIIPRGWAEIDDITDADGNRGPGYRLANEADARGTVASPNTVAMVPDQDGSTGGAFLFGLADQYAGMPANVVMVGMVSDNRIVKGPDGPLNETVSREVDKAATESHRPAEVITIEGVDIIETPKQG